METTLSGKTYIRLFRRAWELGYEIELHSVWLSRPTQAIARVRGGHHVPAADIRRRFKRSLVHLLDDCLPSAILRRSAELDANPGPAVPVTDEWCEQLKRKLRDAPAQAPTR